MTLKADVQATAAAGFIDKRSYIAKDGRHVLLGKRDWDARKAELEERSGGRCEFFYFVSGGERCSKLATIPAHIIPRHPLRDDRLSNLMHYCWEHDRMTEKQGWRRTRFGEKAGEGETNETKDS